MKTKGHTEKMRLTIEFADNGIILRNPDCEDIVELALTRRIGLFSLSDLRKIAPIGDLGYANGWETFYGTGWMNGGLENAIGATTSSTAPSRAVAVRTRAGGWSRKGLTLPQGPGKPTDKLNVRASDGCSSFN